MITQSELSALFHYDPETGNFTRLITVKYNAIKGSVAGSISTNGYLRIRIRNKYYLSHRLAWLYVYGCWPTQFVDHINGVKTDNRINNLRQAEGSQNYYNTGMRSHNTSGAKGVSLHARTGRWKARCSVNKREFHLGLFDTVSEASAAYEEFAREHFGEFYRP